MNMAKSNSIKLFEDRQVRSAWDAEAEKWYISIVDVVGVLTESPNPQQLLESPEKQVKERGKRVGYKLQPTENAVHRR